MVNYQCLESGDRCRAKKGGSRWTAAALLSLAKALCTAIHEGERIK